MPAWVRVSATFTGLGANESLGVPAPMAPVAWGVCCVSFFLRALVVGAIEDGFRLAVEYWVVLSAPLAAASRCCASTTASIAAAAALNIAAPRCRIASLSMQSARG